MTSRSVVGRSKRKRLTAQRDLSAVLRGQAIWVGVLHKQEDVYDMGEKNEQRHVFSLE